MKIESLKDKYSVCFLEFIKSLINFEIKDRPNFNDLKEDLNIFLEKNSNNYFVNQNNKKILDDKEEIFLKDFLFVKEDNIKKAIEKKINPLKEKDSNLKSGLLIFLLKNFIFK